MKQDRQATTAPPGARQFADGGSLCAVRGPMKCPPSPPALLRPVIYFCLAAAAVCAAADGGSPVATETDNVPKEMKKDADMHKVLERFEKLGGKPVEKITPEEARRQPTGLTGFEHGDLTGAFEQAAGDGEACDARSDDCYLHALALLRVRSLLRRWVRGLSHLAAIEDASIRARG